MKRKRFPKKGPNVVSSMGWGVSEVQMADSAKTVFRGELMVCALCRAKHRSSQRANSQWRALELDGHRFYVCPNHFPPDGSSTQAFRDAYVFVLKRLVNLLAECPGHGRGGVGANCCDRAGQYNGFASGPLLFQCPRHCSCHD